MTERQITELRDLLRKILGRIGDCVRVVSTLRTRDEILFERIARLETSIDIMALAVARMAQAVEGSKVRPPGGKDES